MYTSSISQFLYTSATTITNMPVSPYITDSVKYKPLLFTDRESHSLTFLLYTDYMRSLAWQLLHSQKSLHSFLRMGFCYWGKIGTFFHTSSEHSTPWIVCEECNAFCKWISSFWPELSHTEVCVSVWKLMLTWCAIAPVPLWFHGFINVHQQHFAVSLCVWNYDSQYPIISSLESLYQI